MPIQEEILFDKLTDFEKIVSLFCDRPNFNFFKIKFLYNEEFDKDKDLKNRNSCF